MQASRSRIANTVTTTSPRKTRRGRRAAAHGRAARRGAWAGDFTAPWDARRAGDTQPRQLQRVSGDGVSGCRGTGIKGNISKPSGERIYHVPGSSSYDETRIDEGDGERWFCTEEDARRAGWRPRR